MGKLNIIEKSSNTLRVSTLAPINQLKLTTMTTATMQNRTLQNHIKHSKGSKTVCVTTCLNFFNIPFDSYHYTSSDRNRDTYKSVLRRFGWSVRSKKSEFKALKSITMTQLRRNMKKSIYSCSDYFIVHGYQSKVGHLMVLNGNGETVIDTAEGSKWRIAGVSIVEPQVEPVATPEVVAYNNLSEAKNAIYLKYCNS
tara:strand:+ start:133 stop:723 length:591 start_codon:yes stop_codon:yes gene_type:complete